MSTARRAARTARWPAACALVAALAACTQAGAPAGSTTPAPTEEATSPGTPGTPTRVQPVQIVIAATDLGRGEDRFAFAILDESSTLLRAVDARVQFFTLEGDKATAQEEVTPTFYPSAKEDAGLYVVNYEFDRAGPWGAQIRGVLPDGTPIAPQRVRFTVAEDPAAPAVGEQAPATANPTVSPGATKEELARITSDPEPDASLYAMTVDEAAASGKPTVVVFATPGYCQSKLCQPVLDEVKRSKARFGDEVNFIHVEVYGSFDPLELSPLMGQWGLSTEPWVFVLDRNGRVAERLEGSVTTAELDPLLEELTGGT